MDTLLGVHPIVPWLFGKKNKHTFGLAILLVPFLGEKVTLDKGEIATSK